jgi:hypothetical protein
MTICDREEARATTDVEQQSTIFPFILFDPEELSDAVL